MREEPVDLSRVVKAGDREVLEELVRGGDSLIVARHTKAFFYVLADDTRNAETALNPLALRATQFGWRVAKIDSGGLIIESERPATPDDVNEMSRLMDSWADEFGVEYDGWECAALKGDE